jgi:hypothetical protein
VYGKYCCTSYHPPPASTPSKPVIKHVEDEYLTGWTAEISAVAKDASWRKYVAARGSRAEAVAVVPLCLKGKAARYWDLVQKEKKKKEKVKRELAKLK